MPVRRRSPATPFLQFCCVLLVCTGVPALVCRSATLERWLRIKEVKPAALKRVMPAAGRVQDAASGREELQRHRPDWVLIGNSMLHSRIEDEYFQQLTGHRVFKLSISSTKSAMWYLMLKLMVVQSEVKPKCVTIFFRDRDLTWPELRMHRNAEMIERMKGRDEPEWDVVMGDYDDALGIDQPLAALVDGVSGGLQTLLPAAGLREWARSRMQKTAFDLGGFGDPRDYPERRAEVNDRLSLDHLRKRKDTTPDADEGLDEFRKAAEELERVEPLVFDPSPEKSFLPHMVALSRQHGFKLHFHRIKLNPELPPSVAESEVTLPVYLDSLRAYLKASGCAYTDESSEQGITAGMYVDDVHIKSDQDIQQSYMSVFWRHVQPLIDGVMQASDARVTSGTAS